MAEPNTFPTSDAPEPITRKFPDFVCVDGVASRTFSIVRVPDQPEDIYHFAVWSEYGQESFRTTPRQDIDLVLKAYNLPPSRYLLYNHTVIHEDDLDTELDYSDHDSYGFVIQIERIEFQAYYKMLTESPLVQDRFDDMLLVWQWRHLPFEDGNDCNFLVFHIPEEANDVTGPLTTDEMLEIFRDHYNGSNPRGRLRLMVDCDAGDYGNIFVVEKFATDEDDCENFGRVVVLPTTDFIVSTDMNDILFGFRLRMQAGDDSNIADGDPEHYEIPIGLNDDLEFPVFGAPGQTLFLEDLLGPDYH